MLEVSRMPQDAHKIEVYLEVGKTKTIAAALDWPGWCRGGRDEAAALQALFDYAPRYARVLQTTPLGFHPPSDISALLVVERLAGNSSTDFGVPGLAPSGDTRTVTPSELQRWQVLLQACWQAFDSVVQAAAGRELTKGPRGGGRDLTKIIEHVVGANGGYISSLGGKLEQSGQDDIPQSITRVRDTILTALAAAVRGEFPARGPRGGHRWTPRYFVRRLAWHELDHIWEIEDRAGLHLTT
jgi:hypothetical protein